MMMGHSHTHLEVSSMWKAMPSLILTVLLVSLVPGVVTGAAAQKVALTIRDFSYTPDKVTLQAGVPVEITIVNKGKVKHEFMLHTKPKVGMSGMRFHEWAEDNSYFKGVQVVAEGSGIEVERKGMNVVEVQIGAGKTAIVKFTPTKKGTFEYACLITGHYEQGQKGTLTVE